MLGPSDVQDKSPLAVLWLYLSSNNHQMWWKTDKQQQKLVCINLNYYYYQTFNKTNNSRSPLQTGYEILVRTLSCTRERIRQEEDSERKNKRESEELWENGEAANFATPWSWTVSWSEEENYLRLIVGTKKYLRLIVGQKNIRKCHLTMEKIFRWEQRTSTSLWPTRKSTCLQACSKICLFKI